MIFEHKTISDMVEVVAMTTALLVSHFLLMEHGRACACSCSQLGVGLPRRCNDVIRHRFCCCRRCRCCANCRPYSSTLDVRQWVEGGLLTTPTHHLVLAHAWSTRLLQSACGGSARDETQRVRQSQQPHHFTTYKNDWTAPRRGSRHASASGVVTRQRLTSPNSPLFHPRVWQITGGVEIITKQTPATSK